MRLVMGLLLVFALALVLPFSAASTNTTLSSQPVTAVLSTTSGGAGGSTGAPGASVVYSAVGGEFKVVEYSNPSTGYGWVVVVDDPKVVAYNGYKATDCQTQTASADGSITAVSVGAGCNHTYYFKATAEGKTAVTMKYMRSWDANSTVKTKQFTVVVHSANATAVTIATAVPAPPISQTQVEIKIQKGWNLFSLPSAYAGFAKTTCTRERAYYYDAATANYVASSIKSISGPKAHWLYSTEACTVVFSEKSAYKKDAFKEELKPGWNAIGAPLGDMIKASKCELVQTDAGATDRCISYVEYVPVKISDYKGTCNIVAAYSFDTQANNWAAASTLEAKKGYFVKVSEACKMYAPDETASIPALPE